MSKSANAMMSYVPQYYRDSRFYQAHNEAKGQEFDILLALINDLPNQFDPLKATWAVPLWEEMCGMPTNPSDSLQTRRDRVYTQLIALSPLTPYELMKQVKAAFGVDIDLSWSRKPYTVDISAPGHEGDFDFTRIANMLWSILPAHLDLTLDVDTPIRGAMYFGGAVGEFSEEVVC